MKKFFFISATAGLLLLPQMLFSAPWSITRDLLSFDRYEGDPAWLETVKKTGLMSLEKMPKMPSPQRPEYIYDFTVPADGWYEVHTAPVAGVEYTMDGTVYGKTRFFKDWSLLNSFYLTKGKHTLKLAKHDPPDKWFNCKDFTIREASDDPVARTLLQGDKFVYEAVVPKNGFYTIHATTGWKKAGTLTLEVLDPKKEKGAKDHRVINSVSLAVPASGHFKTDLFLHVPEAGIFNIRCKINGKIVPSGELARYSIIAIDVSPDANIGKEFPKNLVSELDCVKTEPEYGAGGTRIIHKPFGDYRNTGKVGYLTHMNSTDPSWNGWKISFPTPEKRYWVEWDYPDDAYRNNTYFLRDPKPTNYNFALGFDSGHDYPLTESMKTMGAFFYPRSQDCRFLAAPATDLTSGAAVAKFRIYDTGDKALPPLMKKQNNERHFATFYEEGSSVLGLFGATMPHPSKEEVLRSLDRWTQCAGYMGYNFAIYTIMVYQAGLHPSSIYSYSTKTSSDIAEMFLLYAQKRGIDVVFEFSPVPLALLKNYNNTNRLCDRFGKTSPRRPHLIPIHPVNRNWLKALARETMERYVHTPSFKGISMRQMNFHNNCLTNWQSLDWGYEDFTVDLFEKETGIKVPDTNAADPDRFEKRYQFLTGPKRAEWIKWRCQKVREIYEDLSSIAASISPNLKIYVHDMFAEDPIAAGVDFADLSKIPGVEVIRSNGSYGRRTSKMRQKLLSNMLNDPKDFRLAQSGASYFECTGDAFLPEQIGFDKKTRRVWSSGVHNPAGRLFLERASVPLGRADILMYSDGGNTYTIGQPEWRDWVREYRSIPVQKFEIRQDASDPVAVRTYKNMFYAVSMVPYDTEAVIAFDKKNGKAKVKRLYDNAAENLEADGSLKLKLKAYELRTFSADASVKSVKVSVPEFIKKKSCLMLNTLKDTVSSLSAPDQIKIDVLVKKLENLLQQNRFWEFRATIDAAENLFEETGILLPHFHRDGVPATPENALSAKQLEKTCISENTLIPSETFIPAWNGEKILASKPGKTLEINVPVIAVGKYRLRVGYVSSKDFGSVRIKIDGKFLGKIISSGDLPMAREILPVTTIDLRDGLKKLEVIPEDEKAAGISYVSLEPILTPISAFRWKIGPIHPVKSMETILDTEKTFDFNDWKPAAGTGPYVSLTGGDPSFVPERVRFAVTHIYSPDARKVRLVYGTDYWIKMWLNRQCIKPDAKRTKGGHPQRGEDFIDLNLKPGWNEFLIKVSSGGHGFGVWMEITNDNGLIFSADPQAAAGNRKPDIPANGKMLFQTGFEEPFPNSCLKRIESEKDAFSGKYYAKLLRTPLLYFKVTPGKTYCLQGYFKGAYDGASGRLQAVWMTRTRKMLYMSRTIEKLSTDWKLIRCIAKAPVGADKASIVMDAAAIDDLWFGEIPGE